MALSPSYKKTSPKTSPNIFPSSQYLQERLEERRARASRPRRSRQSDIGPRSTIGNDDDIFVNEADSSRSSTHAYGDVPAITLTSRDAGRTELNAPARSRTVGARQLDEQLDRLAKQNFDLKLEVDHRRAHQVKLEAELKRMQVSAERVEQLAEEHAELLKINSELVEELEKRDKAMQEAVEIICDLEEKLDDLEDDKQSVTRASTVHADSGYAGTETHDAMMAASPPKAAKNKSASAKLSSPSAASQALGKVLNSGPAKSRREPAFLTKINGNTDALRSVYRESNKELKTIKSFHSILSKHASTIDDEDSQYDALNSPRFSNLSESSFPSIYSPKKISPARHAWEPQDDAVQPMPTSQRGLHTRQDSISRVSQWIEGYDVTAATLTGQHVMGDHAVRAASPHSVASAFRNDHFQSLNNALSLTQVDGDVPYRAHTALADSRRSSRTPTSFGGPIFGEPLVSPSPDSAARSMLRSSRSTIIEEKSFIDAPTARFKGLQALEAELRTAPKQMRSSVELNSAFVSNAEYRKTGLSQMLAAHDTASSALDDDGFDQYYRPYPDGGSILTGTPSRFVKRDASAKRESASTGKATVSQSGPRPVVRRKSSSATALDNRKPNLVRAGTSPNILPSLMTVGISSRPKTSSSNEVLSPMSYNSTSSSNRTAFGTSEQRNRTLSPVGPRSPPRSTSRRGTDRVPASPRSTLSQRTQLLFRRLSGSQGSDRDREFDGQISPSPSRPTLPTLTSTPSSAYVNVPPKELRRANANSALDTPKSASPAQFPVPQTSVRTPTPSRTRILSEIRQATPSTDPAGEKRGFFGRRGSFKQATGLDRSKTATPSTRGRRRSSVREAIASGKVWS